MKSRQSLLIFLLVLITPVIHQHAYAGGRDVPVKHGGYTTNDLLSSFTDTVPSIPKALEKAAKAGAAAAKNTLPKAPPVKVNNNLFKKVAESFKFRKHAREAEKQRVLNIFEALGINDSIAATSENIQLLIDELSVRENQHFDSLIAIINEIRAANQRTAAQQPEVKVVVPDNEAPSPSASKVVTDKDIDDLTNKLLPLISEKANEDKADKNKREALKALRQLKFGANETNYIVDTTKGIVKRFHLLIRNRIEVYGMHNYNSTSGYEDYKFGYINALIYNSLFINGKTGDIKELNGWDTAPIIKDAEAAGCRVYFTAAIKQPASIVNFLGDVVSQHKFVDNAIFLLKLRKASGVNIAMDDLPLQERDRFTAFIKMLSETLKLKDTSYRVLVTVPAHDRKMSYDMSAVAEYADRIIIDFSKLDSRSLGPIAPLKGKADYTIETSVSRYLNADIPPAKIVVNLPYSGAKWLIDQSSKKAKFIQTLTYSEIRNRYNWPVYYDEQSGNAVMDSLNAKQLPVRKIWYDDEISLGDKYDFIISNGLGGVSIDALGYDKGFGELWDAMAYKVARIDTVYMKDSLILKPVNTNLSFLEKLERKMELYWYILKNPCEVCFEDIKDPKYRTSINQYLEELKIDSLRTAANLHRDPEDRFKSQFEYVNHELTSFLGYLALFFLLAVVICGCIYVYQIKEKSEEWTWKKYAEITLIVLAILFIISAFAYLFSNDSIPLFGSTPAPVGSKVPMAAVVSTDSSDVVALKDTSMVTVVSSSSCITDPNTTCINMPLPTLMAIITAGMLVGLLLTRYLIMPLIKRDDVP